MFSNNTIDTQRSEPDARYWGDPSWPAFVQIEVVSHNQSLHDVFFMVRQKYVVADERRKVETVLNVAHTIIDVMGGIDAITEQVNANPAQERYAAGRRGHGINRQAHDAQGMTRLISVYNTGPKGEALRHIPNSQVSQIMQNTNVHSLAVQIFASVDQNFKSSQEEIIARMQWNTEDKYFMIRKALETEVPINSYIHDIHDGVNSHVHFYSSPPLMDIEREPDNEDGQ